MLARRLLFTAAALIACASPALAQKAAPPPIAPACDTAGKLIHAPEIKNALRATLNKACGSYQLLLSGLTFDPSWTAAQLMAFVLHGAAPFVTPPDTTKIPPRDTTKVPPPPPIDSSPPPATWTKCTAAGAMCYFTGLRTVRLSNADNSKFITQVAYHVVPCAAYGFPGQSAPTGSLHCDFGPAKTDTLAVPVAMGPITAARIVVPRGSSGSATQDVQNGDGNGTFTDGSGSFRTTCSLAKFLFDDPVVAPRQPGKSHLHMFFGNVAIDANTTTTSILTGNSTCRGGTLNRTGYWTPAMVDANGAAVMPDEATVYYKTGYNMKPAATQVLPVGLSMIAGDKLATGPQVAPGPLPITSWDCLSADLGSVKGTDGKTIPTGYLIPKTCPVGAMVRLTVFFPSCWNGRDLDSPDHKSHMAYPNFSKGTCDDSLHAHPVQVPQISEHFDWPVTAGANVAGWHLSSDMDLTKPGMSAHADWMMGWDAPTMLSLVQNCLQKALDCGVGGIGGNRSLY